MKTLTKHFERLLGVSAALLAFGAGPAMATIDGISGTPGTPTFNLVAKADYVSTGDGQSLLSWGYANGAATMQYPGPTLIVNQGDQVTINLSSQLPVATSIVFPGQVGVATSCDAPVPSGSQGDLTCEAPAGGATVTYTFTAGQPGTYMYHSGTRPDVQVEMGLVGALIVRPSGANALTRAYGHADSAFDHEYLFLLTEMDPKIHERVQTAGSDQVDTSDYQAVLWFINGRNGPDTVSGANLPWMPTQPYNILPRAHPGDKVLLRLIGAGRDVHPFHTHGNNHVIIARDGRLLASTAGVGADLAMSNYTVPVSPGSTYDAIFTWTGKGLGWDIYGNTAHNCDNPTGYDSVTREWCPDHGKGIQVYTPSQLDMTNGQFWSGSPYLGTAGALPPGEGGINLNAGYFFMWHSHTEKELTNHDVFPGGMMTMFIVEPPGVVIE
jgi:FtsP/CotA-like multicopper oxidase with cupredoxin domain